MKRFHLFVSLVAFFVSPQVVWAISAEFVATSHAEFASDLAAFGVVVGSNQDWVAAISPECRIDHDAFITLPIRGQELASAYVEKFCEPWDAWVASVLDPCDLEEQPPKWCEDEIATIGRLQPGAYFRTLYRQMGEAEDPLVRLNLLLMFSDRLNVPFSGSFPPESWQPLLAKALSECLPRCSSSEMLFVVDSLQSAFPPIPASISDLLAQHVGAEKGSSIEQIQQMLSENAEEH